MNCETIVRHAGIYHAAAGKCRGAGLASTVKDGARCPETRSPNNIARAGTPIAIVAVAVIFVRYRFFLSLRMEDSVMRFLLAVAVAFAVVLAGTAAKAAAPDQTKPDQVKPDQAKHVKPDQAKAKYVKPDQAKPDQVKVAKPDQAKAKYVKPDQAKPDQVKPDQVKTGKHRITHVRHAKLNYKLAHLQLFKHRLRQYA